MRKLILACLTSLGALSTAAPPALAATAVSPTPFMEGQFIANPAPLARKPTGYFFAGDGRTFLQNLRWFAWTSDRFNSVAVATGDEEEYECAPNATSCPIAGGGGVDQGSYVSYPVNVLLEWPTLTSRGFVFTALVVSSPTLGTHVYDILP